jgi:sigma-B regulation protein RsbU (phosphoserine phosphatase)
MIAVPQNAASVIDKMGLAVFESAGEAIVVTDLAATIQYVNPAFERITGYTRDEAIGKNPRMLKSGQHDEAFYKRLWGTLTNGDEWRGSVVNRRKDGTLYHANQTIAPVLDAADILLGYVSVHVDVTERRRLERALHEAEVCRAREAAEHELRLARREMEIAGSIQQNLFPQCGPELDGFDIAGAVFAAEETSGDYYDFVPMPDGTLGVVVGDVSGHGVGPALLMAETRAYLRALAQCCTGIDGILQQTNQLLAQDVEGGRFVTLFFGHLNPRQKSLVYAAAGHTGHHLNEHGVVTPLPPTGLPLGVDGNAPIRCAAPIRLRPGELVLIVTDGLWETRSPDKRLLGIERVLRAARSLRQQPASVIVNTLYEDARTFAKQQQQQDDITIVVMKAL